MFPFSSPQFANGLESIALAAAHVEGENFAGVEFVKSAHGRQVCDVKIEPKHGNESEADDQRVVDMTEVAKEEMLPPPPPPPSSNEIIIAVNKNDVLCGRGGETNHHPGNVQYRRLVKVHQRAYLHAKRRDKPRIARIIVDTIRRQNPSGRFLKKDAISGAWKDVGNVKAREKTSQALREGAPEIRDLLVVPNISGDSSSLCSPPESQLFFAAPAPALFSRVVSDSSETVSSHSSEENNNDDLYHKTNDKIFAQRNTFPHLAKKRKRFQKNSSNLYYQPSSPPHEYANDNHCDEANRLSPRGPRLRIIKARMEIQTNTCVASSIIGTNRIGHKEEFSRDKKVERLFVPSSR